MKTWKELKIKLAGVLFVSFFLSGSVVYTQHPRHDMSKMQGMSNAKPKPKSKATPRKKRKAGKKRQTAKKHDMGNMPGMNMPGMAMPGMHRRKVRPRRRKALPPKMDKMPSPSASPQIQMNMPGMQMPSASPSASPQMQMNMPGMQMPSASPNPQGSPEQKMSMPMPGASPSPGAMSGMKGMEGMPGMGSMNMGPLLVMSGDEMGIRVGSSDSNILSMGAMGSGTSWQPSSAPMHMHYKVAGDWLLMFHYNIVAGVNHQGGPRGVTKIESANWFMPMAYHKLGKGTVQLRGMFSFEPFTFPPGGSPLLFQTGETY